MNLRVSIALLNWEALAPVPVDTVAVVGLVASKEGLMVPDALMRVCDELAGEGIKSIYKTALDGAASKRTVAAMPATPKSE